MNCEDRAQEPTPPQFFFSPGSFLFVVCMVQTPPPTISYPKHISLCLILSFLNSQAGGSDPTIPLTMEVRGAETQSPFLSNQLTNTRHQEHRSSPIWSERRKTRVLEPLKPQPQGNSSPGQPWGRRRPEPKRENKTQSRESPDPRGSDPQGLPVNGDSSGFKGREV